MIGAGMMGPARGPWRISLGDDRDILDGPGRHIAKVTRYGDQDNLPLIVAAPSMLSKLLFIVNNPNLANHPDTISDLRQLITKATGGAVR